MFLEIINAKGETKKDRYKLEETLKKVWFAISDSFFESLI
jgi:hypothetical protein